MLLLKDLLKRNSFEVYFKNISWLIVERIFRLLTSLMIGVWVARYLGPESYGILNYAVTLVLLFSFLITLGLENIVVREIKEKEGKLELILGTTFVLKFLGSLLVILLTQLTLTVLDVDSQIKFLVYIVLISNIFQSFNVINIFYQSKLESKYIAISSIIGLIGSNTVKVIAIIKSLPLHFFAYALVVDGFVACVALIFFYTQINKLSITLWCFKLSYAISLLKESWPYMISSVISGLYIRVDQIFIQEMIGNDALGKYVAATKISESLVIVPILVSKVLFPGIIDAKNISESFYYSKLKNLFSIVVWLSILIALFSSFTSSYIITILYGSDYQESASILSIYVWSGIFSSLGVASSLWISIEKLGSIAFKRTFVGLVINIVLNAIFVPKYGILGAAYTTLATQIFAAYLYDLFDKKTKYIFKLKTKSFYDLKK